MASTITIACPECDKEMKVPAEVLGKKIRCKGCGATFPAKGSGRAPAAPPAKKSPPAKPVKPAKPADKPAKKPSEEDEDASPYGVTEEKASLRCPNCANELDSADAVVCLFCGYNIVTRERARMRKVRDITGGDVFKWLLPGIICVIVIIALITGDILYCLLMNEETIDKDEWYGFIAGLGIKLWLVVTTLFIMYFCGRFAVKRLIFENSPPEVEENY